MKYEARFEIDKETGKLTAIRFGPVEDLPPSAFQVSSALGDADDDDEPAKTRQMSADERVDRLAEYGHIKGPSRSARPACIAIAGHIRDAESAAWDRAVDIARRIAHSRQDPKTTYEVASLKGKCHEVQP